MNWIKAFVFLLVYLKLIWITKSIPKSTFSFQLWIFVWCQVAIYYCNTVLRTRYNINYKWMRKILIRAVICYDHLHSGYVNSSMKNITHCIYGIRCIRTMPKWCFMPGHACPTLSHNAIAWWVSKSLNRFMLAKLLPCW